MSKERKILFIDRDGTLIVEPPSDYQVDSLEKLSFIPEVFTYLRKIVDETGYELVMVTNQDGLGTTSFPEDTFWPAHNKMMETFENEGIVFSKVHIDRTHGDNPGPGRKPGTAMLAEYMDGSVNLAESWVIGDRASDVQLADNLGAKAIYFSRDKLESAVISSNSWKDIYNLLVVPPRIARVSRDTSETQISVEVNLDGSGETSISTGLGFFDHMLEQLGKHGSIDLSVSVKGDLQIDEHHTIEDTALVLGQAFLEALGDKRGISRYGFLLPMDDCLAQVAIDFGGRPWCVWDVEFKREFVGDMPTEMFFHFFKSFSETSKSNLNIKAEGQNEHHKIEAIFKGWARAIKSAVERSSRNRESLPSTKGLL